MSELVGKLSQGVEYYKGDPGPKGDTGPRGEKGEPFRFEDFTPEQLESLKVKGDTGPAGEPGQKGDKGDAFTYADFTQEQLEALRGPAGKDGSNGLDGKNGKDFTYDDFTAEQLEALRGPAGEPGRDGKDGVSIIHTWNGTSLSITSASGTSEVDLKGEKGEAGYTPIKGVDYFDGEPGPAGSDYVLTEEDKQQIANLVPTPDAFEIRFDNETVGSALRNINDRLEGVEIVDLFEGTNITKTNMTVKASYNVLEENLYNDILNRDWRGINVRVEIGGNGWDYGFGCGLDRMITTDEGGNEFLTYQRTSFNEGFGVNKVEINLTKRLIIVVFTDGNQDIGDTATYFRMKFMEVNRFAKDVRAVSPLFSERHNDGADYVINLNYGNGIINNNDTLEIDWDMIHSIVNGENYRDILTGSNCNWPGESTLEFSLQNVNVEIVNDILNNSWHNFEARIAVNGDNWGRRFICNLTVGDQGVYSTTFENDSEMQGVNINFNTMTGAIIYQGAFEFRMSNVNDVVIELVEMNRPVKYINTDETLIRNVNNWGEQVELRLNTDYVRNMINNTLNERLGAIENGTY